MGDWQTDGETDRDIESERQTETKTDRVGYKEMKRQRDKESGVRGRYRPIDKGSVNNNNKRGGGGVHRMQLEYTQGTYTCIVHAYYLRAE